VPVAPIETQAALGDQTLYVDHFGLCIGSVSVGLPLSCTADDVYRRYLDLIRIMRRGPIDTFDAPIADLWALADATFADCAYVARRISALQA
jgi:hypothetical protein